jgi:hypothetical protein
MNQTQTPATTAENNKLVSRQMDDKSRKALWENLNKRIDSIEGDMKIITHWPKEEDSALWPTNEKKEQIFTPEEKQEKAGKPKLAEEIHPDNMRQLNGLRSRINELQLSLRLAFNTNWIVEQRQEMIADTKKIILEEFGPGWEMGLTEDEKATKDKRYAQNIERLNKLTKAVKCNRKGCYTGRGWTGLKVSTGEFALCKCTEDTMQYYKLHD